MDKLLGSFAFLKATWDSEGDHLDQFLPFLATLIVNKKYRKIDIAVLIQDFPREFGFKIPYHPMVTILQRAREIGLVKKNAKGDFVPVEGKMLELDFSAESKRHQEKQQAIIFKLIEFAKKHYNIVISSAEAEAGILSILGNNENDLFKYDGSPLTGR